MIDWARLVREHESMIFGTAWRILGHVQDTEDAVQEVYLQAHRLHRDGRVHHWAPLLRRLAACRALDRLRRRRPTSPLDGLALAAAADAPEQAALQQELADRLRQAVAQLADREAEVFCLHHFEDLTNEQIAQVLDLRPGAVANALYKARLRLQTLLAGAPKENNHA